MVIASHQREHGNLLFTTLYEIASVVLLPRNDIMTQRHRGEGKRATGNLHPVTCSSLLHHSVTPFF